MKHSCIIVPVHIPKFENFATLVRSYHQHFGDDDLIAVFSSEDDRDLFEGGYPDLPRIRSFIVPWEHEGPERSGVITAKKLLAVQQAFDLGYEYAAAIDAECVVIRPTDYDAAFRRWFDRRILFGSRPTCDASRFIRDPLRFFNAAEVARIEEQTRDGLLFSWFNDVPVYERRTFRDFMSKVPLKTVTWYDFDHILYQYHLIAREGFSIEPIRYNGDIAHAPYGFVEDLTRVVYRIPSDALADILNHMRPMWLTRELDRCTSDVFLLFHRDRP